MDETFIIKFTEGILKYFNKYLKDSLKYDEFFELINVTELNSVITLTLESIKKYRGDLTLIKILESNNDLKNKIEKNVDDSIIYGFNIKIDYLFDKILIQIINNYKYRELLNSRDIIYYNQILVYKLSKSSSFLNILDTSTIDRT